MLLVDLSANKTIQLITKNFFQNRAISEFDWKSICSNWTDVLQVEVLNNTIKNELMNRYPLSGNYRKLFLKSLINYLENQNVEVEENLYSEYCHLLTIPNTETAFKYYFVGNKDEVIVLQENHNLICEGTTGLRTWQASLTLADWAIQNKTLFYNKNILELGSGIGLTALSIFFKAEPKRIILSDCHPSVLKTLRDNIKLNVGDNSENSSTSFEDFSYLYTYENSNSTISVVNLPWEKVTKTVCDNFVPIDVIVAADVVFDCELFGYLINTITLFFDSGTKFAIFACTVRNQDTLNEFIKLCERVFIVQEISYLGSVFFENFSKEQVKILQLSKHSTLG